jgi:hypothetical protein
MKAYNWIDRRDRHPDSGILPICFATQGGRAILNHELDHRRVIFEELLVFLKAPFDAII